MSDPTSGMTSAASALKYWERRQEVVSNNLANVSTDGFKAERVFARLVDDALTVPDMATDMRGGSIKPTNSPLDLALDGPGFFVLDSPNGERLTRGGSFHLDETNRIVDAHGNALLAENGAVTVTKGTIEIDKGGSVKVDGHEIAKLRLEAPPAPGLSLQHEGSNMYVPGTARQPLGADARIVRQGALEASNVDSIGAMVDMISVQRAYASVMKTVTTMDEVRRLITNDIGKPV